MRNIPQVRCLRPYKANWMSIPLPSRPKVVLEEANRAIFELENLFPGYGQTIGNSLRRILLSSLEGAVMTSVKIEGVGHEFSTMEGVMEDAVDLILNLKQVRFRAHEKGPFTITLSVKGEREVTAKDFETPSQVEVINTGAHIATLTSKKSNFVLEAVVESGLGYVPVEARTSEKVEVGTIALDAAFSPVRHVNYEVENMRVQDRTDYNKVRFDIQTDGSITPREAFEQAAQILVDQFAALAQGFTEGMPTAPHRVKTAESETVKGEDESDTAEDVVLKVKIDELKISSRTLNALREAGIKTIGGLARKRVEALHEIEGIGEKGLQEIKKALSLMGVSMKE